MILNISCNLFELDNSNVLSYPDMIKCTLNDLYSPHLDLIYMLITLETLLFAMIM